MPRLPLLLAAAVAAIAAAGSAPASASATGAPCGGAYDGPRTCSFELGPDHTGFRITLVADPGTFAAGRARCCRVATPAGDLYLRGTSCAVGGPNGGFCSSSDFAVPVGERTVVCEIAALDDEPMSGTWSCEPV